MKQESRLFTVIALSFITGLAGYLRMYGITWLEPIGDEYAGLEYATLPLSVIIDGVYDPYHPVLYFSILHYLTIFFGKSILAARILSVLAGTMTVPLLYLFASRLTDKKTGLFAALLLSLSNIHIIWSHYARMYSLLPFFAVLFAYSGFRAAQRRDGSGWILFILSGILLLYTHYFGAVFFAIIILAFLIGLRNQVIHNRNFFVSLGVIALLFLPQVYLLLGQEGVGRRHWQDVGEGFVVIVRTFLNFLPIEQFFRRLYLCWILLAFLIPSMPLRILCFVAIPALLPSPAVYLFSLWVTPIYWDRYMVSAVPFLCIIAASGLKSITGAINHLFRYRTIAAPLSIAVLLWSSWFAFEKSGDSADRLNRLHISSNPFSSVIEYIEKHEESSRIIFTSEPMPYIFSLGNSRYSIIDLTGGGSVLADQKKWSELWKDPWFEYSEGRFWVVLASAELGTWSLSKPFIRWFLSENTIIEEKKFSTLELYLAKPRHIERNKLQEIHENALKDVSLQPLEFGSSEKQSK